ncbi:DUF4402 domain-containing protein [Sphingomonas sp.]|uniref:DUF4402 domain-containing protein n=1 Tax=Sphingomonas sp. TaxID=28214 RepID=UPI0018098815|nr:DUF4402 domain-containing protein [Sphingomonas sp.]MBA3510515.1 DUF4402 domain-containing protein [Sphingomonas sp.]
MTGVFHFRGLLVGLAALVAPTLAQAAPVAPDKDARSTVRITPPATVRKLEDLNFASLSVTTAGTAIVNPNTDTMTTTGGVLHAGGTPYAALFEAVSPIRAVVIIRIPRDPITVTRVNGTETMTVSNWTMSGNARRTVAAQEAFEFKVGGTLFVNANQVEGLYLGTFTVEIQYP